MLYSYCNRENNPNTFDYMAEFGGGMEMTVKKRALIITAAVLVFVAICSISLVAKAEDKKSKEYRMQIESNEKTYVKEVKNYLSENGFANAGVNLTKTTDENMNLSYKLVLNHHSFMYAKAEKTAMIEDLLSDSECFYLDGPVSVEFSY